MVATVTMDGKRYVLVPQDEYELLRLRPIPGDEPDLPPLPAIGPDGLYPAIEYATVSLARKLILHRRRLGLTQAEVARRAGIRVETLNRIERVKVTPSVRTVQKIDAVFRQAETGVQAGPKPAKARPKPSASSRPRQLRSPRSGSKAIAK